MTKKRYRHQDRVIGVELGLGDQYIVVWRSGQSSSHRVVSKYLAPQSTQSEMQELLDVWAAKKGLHEVEEEMKETSSRATKTNCQEPGRRVPPGGLVSGKVYLIRHRNDDTKPKEVIYHGQSADDAYVWTYLANMGGCPAGLKILTSAALAHYEIRECAAEVGK